MTIGRLRGVLATIGLSVSARELTEILWLACQLTAEQAEPDGQLGDDHSSYQQPGHLGTQEGLVESASQSQTEDGITQASKTGGEIAAHGLYAHAAANGHSFDVGTTEVPTAPMLHDTLAVQRALRPLKRKVASHRAGELDEDATARRIAEQPPNRRRWVPIMRPSPERWLNLALVVDTGPSMSVWRPLARELQEALTRLGAFRDLRVWYLNGGEVATTAGGPPLNAAALLDASGRQVCLVLSDCSGAHWWNGPAPQALHLWGQNSPTAILQPLAERLWCRTAAPPVPGLAHSRRAVAPNTELCFTPHEASRERGMPVPVLEISPLWLADWTRLIVGSSSALLPMAVAYVSGKRMTRAEPLQREGDLSITERVQRFQATASPGAVRLAAHVAVSVPTLPVMRLIHHQLLPNPEPGHIAEVLLSGLLRPVDGEPGRYEFVPGARQALLATLPRSESWHAAYILSRISAEIENRAGRVGEVFRAYLQVQHGAGERALVSNRPFALVSHEALRYLRFDAAMLLSPGQQRFQQADQLHDLRESAFSGGTPPDSRQMAEKAPNDRIDMGDSGPESSVVPSDSPLGEDVRPVIQESRSQSEPSAEPSAATPTASRWLRRGTPIYCPYCYSRFAARDIQFRCSGRLGRHNTRCNSVIDEVLLSRTGFTEPLPPVFSADGRSVMALCPYCNNETAIRVCPACHSTLPAHFGMVKSRVIALVGARESGKTVFMTVLLHELMNHIGNRFGAAVSAADDATLHRFSREYEAMLYRDALLLPATQPASLSRLEPIVFRITTQERRLLGTTRTQRTMLSFYDAAGQDFSSQRDLEQNIRYLSAADGILLLLDPLQMPGARDLVNPGTRLPMTGSVADDPTNIFYRITDLLQSRSDPRKKITKPVAIIFTKIDALRHDLKGTSPLFRPAPEGPFFDETDSQEVHSEVLRLLNLWHGTRIDQIANVNYQRYRYFALSALGDSPTGDNRISPARIRPYRVADPFLWLLAEFGIIRAKRG